MVKVGDTALYLGLLGLFVNELAGIVSLNEFLLLRFNAFDVGSDIIDVCLQ